MGDQKQKDVIVNRLCTIPSCTGQQSALGLCKQHYQKSYRIDNKDRIHAYDNLRTLDRKEWKTAYDKMYRYKAKGKYKKTIYDARKRGLVFSITEEEYTKLINSPCTYCGIKHETMTVDRIDSAVGYISGNVAAACRPCNTMKWVLSVQEFKEHIKRIYEFFVKE